jgi:hydroxymethylbilane synthase
MLAVVASPDGETMATVTLTAAEGESAQNFGSRAAQVLIDQGARELLAEDFAAAEAE